MAAPGGTTWGSIVGSGSKQGRIGIYVSVSNSNTQSTVSIQVYFWSRYAVSDSGNNFYFNNESTSATTNRGSVNINTTGNSGSGWSTGNQVLLKSYSYTYNRGTSNVTKSCAAKLTGIEYASGTMTVTKSYTIPVLSSYTVSYNANGGSGAPGKQTKYYGKTLKLSSTIPTKTGHTFQGWATSSSGQVAYSSGSNYTGNSSITLYAVWKANTWNVYYNANGGSGGPVTQTKTYGIDLIISDEIPTRVNYNFLGWALSSDATIESYHPGDVYKDNLSITLYAVWELAYKAPIITGLSADRCNELGVLSEDGQYAKINFSWEIDAINSGGLVDIVIKWIQSSQTEQNDWNFITILSGGSDMNGTVSCVIGDNLLNTEYNYNIQVVITDKKGNALYSVVLPAMSYIIDFLSGGHGVSFGKPASRECFDVGMEAYFGKNMYDKYERLITNGLAVDDSLNQINPNETLDDLILTNKNTPNGGYMYIRTVFYDNKTINSNRAQDALPYNSSGSTYHRYYYNGSWSTWEKHVTESQLNSNLDEIFDHSMVDVKNNLGNAGSNDVLANARSSKHFLSIISTGQNTTNVPDDQFRYAPGIVLRRTSEQIAILLFSRDNRIATNFYNGTNWSGWKIR